MKNLRFLLLDRGRCVAVAFVAALLSALISPVAAGEVVEEVPLYGVYEATIDYDARTGHSHPYVDPFYGVEVVATFTSPSGRSIPWWGFHDGDGQGGQSGNIWKVRFMPDELGTWDLAWHFSDGSVSGSGSFRSVDTPTHPRKPGPLRHDPDIHQWLVSSDGSRRVFTNMYNAWRATNAEPYVHPRDAIAEVTDNGFDVIALWSSVYFRNEPMNGSNPMIFVETHDYMPRLRGWHLLENGIYAEAYEQGVYVYEWDGFYSGNGLYDLYRRSTALQDQVIKYWLARTAPYYVFLYNVGFELPEYVSVPAWPVSQAERIKDLDPFDHLITGHELHGWSYADYPVMDFSALQNNDQFHSRALQVWDSPAETHPHCSECIWNAPWQSPGTETSHRRDLWDGITGGMSNFLFARDNAIGLTAFRHANAFLNSGPQWWTMRPHDEVVMSGTAYVLAIPGLEYIAYSSSGSSFTLDLPSGNYEWRWFDPGTGEYGESGLFDATDGSVSFQKPDSSDWVLHLSSTSDPTPTCQSDGECEDGNGCTLDRCDALAGCVQDALANGTACDDENPFTLNDVCDDGDCVGLVPECTSNAACADADVCNGEERCIDYACEAGLPLSCPPPTDCTLTLCDPEAGCRIEPVAEGTSCNDGDPDTLADQCEAGTCVGVTPACGSDAECDDGNVCTADQCDPLVGCLDEPVTDGTPCDNRLFCTTADQCIGGECAAGAPRDCSGLGDQCSVGVCDESADTCVVQPANEAATCDDADACTTGETCQSGQCTNATLVNCDDENACTTDSCDPAAGCVHTPVPDDPGCHDVQTFDCPTNKICFFVSPAGSDANGDGTLDSPFSTPERCQCEAYKATALSEAGTICIFLPGVYERAYRWGWVLGGPSTKWSSPDVCDIERPRGGTSSKPMRFTSYAWNNPAVFQSADPDNFETLTFWDGTPINYFELDHLILKHRVRLFGSGTNHHTYHHNKFVCPGDGEDESNVGHIFGCATTPDTCRNIHIYENLFLADGGCSYDGFSARPNWMHLYGWSNSVIENNDFRSTGVTINNGVGPKMANQNLEIRYNYIQGNVEEPLWFNGCPDNGSTCGNRAYQNVIDGGASHSVLTGLTWWSSTNQANEYFYNNTVYNASRCLYAAADRGLSGNHFFNNICVGIEQGGQRWEQQAASAALIVSDYNLYSPDPTFRDCWYGGAGCSGQQYGSVAAWAGGTSLDTHSLTTNPLLGDPGSGDFRPCIDVGVPHPLCTGPSPAIRHCEGGPNHGTGCSSNGDCGGASCVASGRGGPWPSVMGAYITGQEQIGCSFDPACFSSNADSFDDSENPIECTSDSACDDADICNGEEQCVDYACEGGLPLSCPPATDCALTLCDPEAGCQVEPVADGTSCNDGDPNTLADQCDAGSCVGVAPVCGSDAECDDGNACTADHCNPLAGCLSEPVTNGTPCEDGLSCTTGESCQNGSCSSGLPVSCNDQSVCTTDGCDEELGCVHGATADGTPCDDGDPSTIDDACASGVCVGTGVSATLTSLTANAPAPQPPGTEITFTAAASAGERTLEYRWWVLERERWVTRQGWSLRSTFVWTPSRADPEARVGVWVRVPGERKYVKAVLPFPIEQTTVQPPPELRLSSDLSAPQPVGASITFTAEAGGDGAPLEYRWWVRERAGWRMVRNWSPSSAFVWTPSRADPEARVGVWVRVLGERKYVKAVLPFPIAKIPVTASRPVSLSSNLSAPQPVGTPITFTAEAGGNGEPLEYRWWVRQSGQWVMVRDWSAASTFVWTPDTADPQSKVGIWFREIGQSDYDVTAIPFGIKRR